MLFFLKRWVFNFLLKVSIEMDSLINLGTAFHNLGAANRKARSPRVALGLTFGLLSRVLSLTHYTGWLLVSARKVDGIQWRIQPSR